MMKSRHASQGTITRVVIVTVLAIACQAARAAPRCGNLICARGIKDLSDWMTQFSGMIADYAETHAQ